jgi:hypothetical protein
VLLLKFLALCKGYSEYATTSSLDIVTVLKQNKLFRGRIMATATQKPDNTIFGDNRMQQSSLSQNGMKRSEWWLNVNYAEVVEVNRALSALQRARN